MANFINRLSIENFKSIQKLELNCKRINVFIGHPNTGKSNILEALTLYELPALLKLFDNNPNTLSDHLQRKVLRYENLIDLFYFKNRNNPVKVISETGIINFSYNSFFSSYSLTTAADNNQFSQLEDLLEKGGILNDDFFKELQKNNIRPVSPSGIVSPSLHTFGLDNKPIVSHSYPFYTAVRRYEFERYTTSKDFITPFPSGSLITPFGTNIISMLESHNDLRQIVTEYFREYNLDLVIDRASHNAVLQRRVNDFIDTIPFTSVADTLQRIIFHLAAIYSNKQKILLFEEPEAHSFPKYISILAEAIAGDEHNQYFITTHSPYILTTLFENKGISKDLAVHLVGYKDHQTVCKTLSEEQLADMYNAGTTLFFNLETYLND